MELKELTGYLDELRETSDNDNEKKKLEAIKELVAKSEEKIELSAISSHKTGISKNPWDGPGNQTNAKTDQDPSYFAKIFAWRDPDGDPKKKTSYKFPHHEVSGDGTPGAANVRGCQAGIAVLNGARGGTTVPGTDKRGIWNHLASHIRDAELEPAKLLEDMTDEEKTKYLEEIAEEVKNEMAEKETEKLQKELEEKNAKIKQLEDEAEKIKAEVEKIKTEKKVEIPEEIESKFKLLEEKFSAVEGEKKKLEETVTKLGETNMILLKKNHEKDVEIKLEGLRTKGIYPAQLEIAKAIMLADGNTVKCFEDDPSNKDQKKTVEKSIHEAVIMMLEALPKEARIDLTEKTRKDHETSGGKPYTFEEMQGKIHKYAEEHKISFEQAQPIVIKEIVEEGRYPLEKSGPDEETGKDFLA